MQENPPKPIEEDSMEAETDSPRFASNAFLAKRHAAVQNLLFSPVNSTFESEINTSRLAKCLTGFLPNEKRAYDELFTASYPMRLEMEEVFKVGKEMNALPLEINVKMSLPPLSSGWLILFLDEDGQESEKTVAIQVQNRFERITLALLFFNPESKEYFYFKRRELIPGESQHLHKSIDLTIWFNCTGTLHGRVICDGIEEVFCFNNCLFPIKENFSLALSCPLNSLMINGFSCKYIQSHDFSQYFQEKSCHCNCRVY